jgi:CheY-like chemotaxis protein
MDSDCSTRPVLVVDDDDSIRTLVRRALERADMTVEIARDGCEAIEMLKTGDYAAVFLDVMMPRIDGFGVIEHLRADDPEMLHRTVLMTAIPSSVDKRTRQQLREILPKPFDISHLITVAEECSSDCRPKRAPVFSSRARRGNDPSVS